MSNFHSLSEAYRWYRHLCLSFSLPPLSCFSWVSSHSMTETTIPHSWHCDIVTIGHHNPTDWSLKSCLIFSVCKVTQKQIWKSDQFYQKERSTPYKKFILMMKRIFLGTSSWVPMTDRQFSNFNGQQNHQADLLSHKLLCPTPKNIWFGRSGVGLENLHF